MAELTTQEKLQPSLLDRLVDDEPHLKQESRDKRVLSMKRLRDAVLRDIAWLMNTACFYPPETLQQCPFVSRSVLNFGFIDLTGKMASGVNGPEIERQLRQTLWNFEPRLVRETLKVVVRTQDKTMCRNAVTITIEGDLWAEPVPLRIYMKTDVDLESGEIQVIEGQ
jgi:type VI secretion system protein ImpF